MSPAAVSSKTAKPQVTFKWDDVATWPIFEKYAKDAGYSSANLFARHLCERALQSECGEKLGPVTDTGLSSRPDEQLATLISALSAVRADIQKIAETDGKTADSLSKIRKAIRTLREVLNAELLQLRGDAAKHLGSARGELVALRNNLADTFALLLVKVDPMVTPEDAKRWVLVNFFGRKG